MALLKKAAIPLTPRHIASNPAGTGSSGIAIRAASENGDRAALLGVAEVSYYLAAPYRGRGIGRRLLSQGLEIAMRNGFHTVIAILLDTNVRSIGLLQSLEFEIWGRMPDIARFENGRCGQLILGRGL